MCLFLRVRSRPRLVGLDGDLKLSSLEFEFESTTSLLWLMMIEVKSDWDPGKRWHSETGQLG